jgi:hypothetical protein
LFDARSSIAEVVRRLAPRRRTPQLFRRTIVVPGAAPDAPAATLVGTRPAGEMARAQHLSIRRDSPGSIVLSDVTVTPTSIDASSPFNGALYTADGRIVEAACLVRGVEGSERMTVAPETIEGARHSPTDDRPFVYVGYFSQHFGHFLTESISRLWFVLTEADPAAMLLFHGNPKVLDAPHVASFFEHLGIPRERFLAPSRTMRISSIVVPSPSTVNKWKIHEVHALAPRRVAEAVLRGRPASECTSRPLYLARRGLRGNRRRILGERALIEALERRGVEVVDPQDETLATQIALLNRHRFVIGPAGSAHHATLFSLQPRTHVYFCHKIIGNSLLIDGLLGNEAHHVRCAAPMLSIKRKWNHLLDVDVAIEACAALGLVAR